MSEENVLQQAVDAVDKYGSITAASDELGVPRQTLSGRYNKAISLGYSVGNLSLTPEQQVGIDAKTKKAAQEKRELRAKYEEAMKQLEIKTKELDAFSDFGESLPFVNPSKMKVVDSGKPSQSTMVACLSDLHYEETIDPRTVSNLNEYSPKIARQRLDNYFQNLLKLNEMFRSKSNIDTLIFWIGGDLIAGYIHEELMESNALSPTEALLEVYEILLSGINFLVEHGGFKQIIIPCSMGNHGRTTLKRRVSTSATNSYEWLLYKFLATFYAKHEVVQFKVTRDYFNYLDIYGKTLRFHHGDNVRYCGGIGGPIVPLNKAIARWNEAKRADLDVLGHLHQRLSSHNFILNGSVIGYGPFSQSIKGGFEKPQQACFLVHPDHFVTVEAPIWVE